MGSNFVTYVNKAGGYDLLPPTLAHPELKGNVAKTEGVTGCFTPLHIGEGDWEMGKGESMILGKRGMHAPNCSTSFDMDAVNITLSNIVIHLLAITSSRGFRANIHVTLIIARGRMGVCMGMKGGRVIIIGSANAANAATSERPALGKTPASGTTNLASPPTSAPRGT